MEDKYKSYTSGQLAGEETFIRWVLHDESSDLWSRWLDQHPHIVQRTEEARRIVLSLTQALDHPFTLSDQKELWNRIDHSIQPGEKIEKPQPITRLWKWGLAAAATLALFFWMNTLLSSEKLNALTGEQKELRLPEESLVTLNAGSSVSYNRKSFDRDRVLELQGEAFFNVKPGSTFKVETDFGTVTVVGTSFNVVSRHDRFEVSCYTGKVKVENNKQVPLMIGAGERSIQNQADFTLRQFTFIPSGETPEWITGKFTFENQPLSIVIGELERQYDVKVKLETGLEDLPYTGLFEAGNLD